MIIQGNTAEWEIVIGLEVHAQVKSKSKLFSGSSTEFGSNPNENVSLFDIALPGTLPVLNDHCVYQAVKTGLAIEAEINLCSVFERKNYFYPDLPSGYQITQIAQPIVLGGVIHIIDDNNNPKDIAVNHIHLEQDAGKSIHGNNTQRSLIDFNRAGVALLEIVSEAELRSPQEAVQYIKKLKAILQYIDSSDADMEKGQLRCDANVSVRKVGDKKLGTRREIKNLNSTRNIAIAIEYEARRQVNVLEEGGEIDQETCLFNANTGETATLRSKEDANDYRYFPDPDLLPLKLTKEYVEDIRKTLPELPDSRLQRYVNDLSLSVYDASVLVSDIDIARYFEKVIKTTRDIKLATNWITVELFARLNKNNIPIIESPVTADNLSELLSLIEDETISGKIAKQVFNEMFDTKKSAKVIVKEKGLEQITDTKVIDEIIESVLSTNQDKVEDYKNGKTKLLGFFVGQVMKRCEGKANPSMLNKILIEKLSK